MKNGTEPITKTQPKEGRGRMVAAIVIVGVTVLVMVAAMLILTGFWDLTPPAPKTFEKDHFQITLTEEFAEVGTTGVYAQYQSGDAMAFVVREKKEDLDAKSLEDYGAKVLEANNRKDIKMHKEADFVWFEYTDTPANQQTYYLAACYESQDAFWIVNFAKPKADNYRETFLAWAKTVKLEK